MDNTMTPYLSKEGDGWVDGNIDSKAQLYDWPSLNITCHCLFTLNF